MYFDINFPIFQDIYIYIFHELTMICLSDSNFVSLTLKYSNIHLDIILC